MANHHAGSAGSRFQDIDHAGRHMLKLTCNNYPMTRTSYILPPLFLSAFPKGNQPNTSKLEPRINPTLSGKEHKKFAGIYFGQGGERTEYKIFYLLIKLLEEEQDVPLLVLGDFKLDAKGKGNLKRKTLMSEYPQITSIDMRGQQDCIIILKDLGFICIEIKRTSSAESGQKAKDQLDRSETFLNGIMPVIAPNSYRLPILKLVMFELDDPQHSRSNFPGYHFFDCSGDSLTAFKLIWINLKQELRSKLPANPLTSLEFKRLVRLLMGLWSMKSMNRQTYFDVNDASVTYLTAQVNVSVDHAYLSSDATKAKIINNPQYAPVTNNVFNHPGTVFREANNINLMYLTPEQKNVYDNVQCGIIRGAAGTGKTLLILFKIIELVQSHDNRKIILLAPHPHTLRCKNILEANGVRVVQKVDIPLEKETIHDVVIIDIRNLHSVLSSQLPMISNHHFFIDDFQSSFDRNDDLSHIGVIMKRAYEIAARNNLYFWCMDDSLQQTYYNNQSKTKQLYEDLFPTTRDDATVPSYTLEKILRNTKEISHVVLDERDNVKSHLNLPSVDAHTSHITSIIPTYHALNELRLEGDSPTSLLYQRSSLWLKTNDVRVDFCVERLEEELRPFVGTKNPMHFSDNAVLYDDSSIKDKLLKRTREMLLTTFNIIPMTIEQQLKSGSPTIVFDGVDNATSGEWPIVIYVRCVTYSHTSSYIGWSRARTNLIMIDIGASTSDTTTLPHFAHVKWRWENSMFVRESDNSSSRHQSPSSLPSSILIQSPAQRSIVSNIFRNLAHWSMILRNIKISK